MCSLKLLIFCLQEIDSCLKFKELSFHLLVGGKINCACSPSALSLKGGALENRLNSLVLLGNINIFCILLLDDL
jgi:hypothetical protein